MNSIENDASSATLIVLRPVASATAVSINWRRKR
jgi:hypothetical protein